MGTYFLALQLLENKVSASAGNWNLTDKRRVLILSISNGVTQGS